MDKMHFLDTVKQSINALGVEIIKLPSIVNVLADYGAFAVPDGKYVKLIVKNLIGDGYGLKVLDWLDKHPSDWKKQNEDYVWDFVSRGQYDKNLVFDITDLLLQAVGLNDDSGKVVGKVISDPWQELNEAKQTYREKLEKLLTKRKDCLGLDIAYYSAEACNELYFYEGKIALLSRFLNVDDAGWCMNQKQNCLAKHQSSEAEKKAVAEKTIDLLSVEYDKLLSDGLIVPKNIFSETTSYYEETDIVKLDEMAMKLSKAKRVLKMAVAIDGSADRQNKIAVANKRRKAVRRVLSVVTAVIALLVILFVVKKIRYAANKTSIIAIESKIAEADSLMRLNQFVDAYNAYNQGFEAYDVDFNKKRYHSIINGRIKELGEQSIEAFERQCAEIRKTECYVPIEELVSIIPLQIRNNDSKRIQNQITSYQNDAETSFERNFDRLLRDISNNNGKMNDNSRGLLDNLLRYKPDDYWLNFIKNRAIKE